MPWKARRLEPIERENDALRTTIVRLRHELRTKQTAVSGLELALHQRHKTIDDLVGKLEWVRDQNRRLNEEADRLAEMVRLSPDPF